MPQGYTWLYIHGLSREGVEGSLREGVVRRETGASTTSGLVRVKSHPTRERLIETMVTLLDQKPPEKINVDEVLLLSGISKGSLYHHFDDFSDLLEVTYLRRFTAYVDFSTAAISDALVNSRTREELLDTLKDITRRTNSPDLLPIRLERIRTIGLAGGNQRFKARLAVEQQRLTDAISDLVREGQSKGWLKASFDPQAVAVFIQAYTFGRVLDEISERPVDIEKWLFLIDSVADTAL